MKKIPPLYEIWIDKIACKLIDSGMNAGNFNKEVAKEIMNSTVTCNNNKQMIEDYTPQVIKALKRYV